jgi:hypothetical protein
MKKFKQNMYLWANICGTSAYNIQILMLMKFIKTRTCVYRERDWKLFVLELQANQSFVSYCLAFEQLLLKQDFAIKRVKTKNNVQISFFLDRESSYSSSKSSSPSSA